MQFHANILTTQFMDISDDIESIFSKNYNYNHRQITWPKMTSYYQFLPKIMENQFQ